MVIGMVSRLGPAWAYNMLLDEAEVLRTKMLNPEDQGGE